MWEIATNEEGLKQPKLKDLLLSNTNLNSEIMGLVIHSVLYYVVHTKIKCKWTLGKIAVEWDNWIVAVCHLIHRISAVFYDIMAGQWDKLLPKIKAMHLPPKTSDLHLEMPKYKIHLQLWQKT